MSDLNGGTASRGAFFHLSFAEGWTTDPEALRQATEDRNAALRRQQALTEQNEDLRTQLE
jgi:hypothetical protein